MGKLIVGLMSGTSVDGIDAALICIKGSGENTKVEVLAFETMKYPVAIRDKIFRAMDPEKSHTPLISSLNFELGYCFAEAVKNVCQKAKIRLDQLDAIGSHGQTIYHIPHATGEWARSTLQIGEPAVIAYETQTGVVSNFRVMDMAAGGQGAPLVPYVDYLLFQNHGCSVALQNIGGIGNVTVIPREAGPEDVYAFDTGPGNMVIDALVDHFYGEPYDSNGRWAKKGRVNEALLSEMMADPYISEKPPKTTGRERFGQSYVRALLNRWGSLPADDLIATATMFTAKSIAANYEKFISPSVEEIIVSGGGGHNHTMMAWLQRLMPETKLKTSDDYGIASDEKEAVAFAILANEMLNGNPANVPGATGARTQVVLGNWTPYRIKS